MFFERVDTSDELSQVADHDLSPHLLIVRTSGYSTEERAFGNVLPHLCAASDFRARSDGEMSREAGFSADEYVVSQDRAPG